MARRKSNYEELEKRALKAEKFSKYINERMEQYGVSVLDIVNGTQLSKKSIYRFINAENPPSKQVEKDIRDYFRKLEVKMLEKEGMRFADENDLSDEKIQELLAEIYWKEAEDEAEERVEDEIYREVDFIKKGIGIYNYDVQKFIVNHFHIFCEIEKADMELVDRVNHLTEEQYAEVIQYLENIPMDIGMITADYDEQLTKMELYIQMLRMENDALPKNKYRRIKEGSDGIVPADINDRLYEEVDIRKRCLDGVPLDILEKIKAVLEYTYKDWYFLFLYERIRNSDKCNPVAKKMELDGRYVGYKEDMFLHLLQIMERKILFKA